MESLAYVVCDALGPDTSDYSLRYVATWSSGHIDKIKQAGDRVVTWARRILSPWTKI